jgi:hypothetical protein
MILGNKKNLLLISLLTLVFIFTSCSYRKITETINKGNLTKSSSNSITVDYFIRHKEGFLAALDFELTSGEVNWEITNPKDETVFKGNVVYENGKVYRELTYPLNYMNGNGNLNNKKEVKIETDVNGNIGDMIDFGYLSFYTDSIDGSISGKYTLKLKPVKAEGSYKITWLDHFPRK